MNLYKLAMDKTRRPLSKRCLSTREKTRNAEFDTKSEELQLKHQSKMKVHLHTHLKHLIKLLEKQSAKLNLLTLLALLL